MRKLMYFFIVVAVLSIIDFSYGLVVSSALEWSSLFIAISLSCLAFVVKDKQYKQTNT